MKFDNTWEIACLINYARENVSDNPREDDENVDTIAKAIELTCKPDEIGFVMPIDMFIDWVEQGGIGPYDGHGYYLDEHGDRIERIDFYSDKIPENIEFIAWYNK